MPEITLDVPDFSGMDDEEVRFHPLSRARDGRWSELSHFLKQHFDTERMSLNEAWAMTPLAWRCPACDRQKIDIARKTDSGVILCHLERHHDHLGDRASKILEESAYGDLPEARYSQRRRACAAVLPLIERFGETLVCADCNAADAAMKKTLGTEVHRDFSFSPTEIKAFIIIQPHEPHRLDHGKGAEVWALADSDFRQRLGFAATIAERLRLGLHDRELHTDTHNIIGYPDAGMLLNLAAHQLGARGNLPRLWRDLRARSCANDGHKSALGKLQRPRVRVPTTQEFAAHDRVMQRPGPWSRSSADWRCSCCSRSKFEIMRLSGKGRWTGQIHDIHDYTAETDARALVFRGIYRAEGLIFRSARKLTICQDCKLLMTDAGKLRADGRGSDNCLSPEVLRSLVGAARAHSRHAVSDDDLREGIEKSREWSGAAEDYWAHCGHATEAGLRLMQYSDGRGLPLDVARKSAIEDLIRTGDLPRWNPEEVFDWLIEERKRLNGDARSGASA